MKCIINDAKLKLATQNDIKKNYINISNVYLILPQSKIYGKRNL